MVYYFGKENAMKKFATKDQYHRECRLGCKRYIQLCLAFRFGADRMNTSAWRQVRYGGHRYMPSKCWL